MNGKNPAGDAKLLGDLNKTPDFIPELHDLRLFKDGNAWCVTGKDFVNLQESPAGFGMTASAAHESYLLNLNAREREQLGDRA